MHARIPLPFFAVVLLFACRSTTPPGPTEAPAVVTGTAAVEASVTAPMDVDQLDSAWIYLQEKYDTDGDDVVTAAEYDRDGGEIGRLDRNGDGVLTADDYASGESMQRMSDTMDAERMVSEYFQNDEDPTKLEIWEMFAGAEAYDANHDELIDEEEFRALAAERRQSLPDPGMGRYTTGMDPWEPLVKVIDENGDGLIAFAELEFFFIAQDDGDDVWDLSPSARSGSAPTGIPASGPTVGTVAPDFVLTPPGGGQTVTLSSFTGEKPVALIFGSYT